MRCSNALTVRGVFTLLYVVLYIVPECSALGCKVSFYADTLKTAILGN